MEQVAIANFIEKEILTLSNCSMSSNFPTNENMSLRSSVTTTNYAPELTFAGKFKDTTTRSAVTIGSLSTMPTTSNSSFNTSISKMPTTCRSGIALKSKSPSQIAMQNINCHSNDNSSSNSHFSQNDFQNQHDSNTLALPAVREAAAAVSLPNVTKLSDDFKTVATTTTKSLETLYSNEKKVPKKRGRKKGSKGVDSVISNETSLSSQMLMTSLSNGIKKVKTTKELYAEIQNRKNTTTNMNNPKLNNTLSSPSTYFLQTTTTPSKITTTTMTSRPDSPNSEISNYSLLRISEDTSKTDTQHTVAGVGEMESDETLTSTEDGTTARYDNNLMKSRKNKKTSVERSNSKTLQRNNNNSALTAIKLELHRLLQQMPVLSIENIELACSKEQIVCSCEVHIINAETNNEKEQPEETAVEVKQDVDEIQIKTEFDVNLIKSKENEKTNANNNDVNENNSLITTAATAVPKVEEIKPKKSIFDFDFDADEDPLLKIEAEVVTLTNVKQQELDNNYIDDEDNKANNDDKLKQNLTNNNNNNIKHNNNNNEFKPPPTQNEHIIAASEMDMIIETTKYEIIEDENCLAKQKYELQTQKINNFHIKCLHDNYVANVNGNWDDATTTTLNEIQTVTTTSIVPTYGVDNLPKYFYPHIVFSLNYAKNKQRLRQMQRLYKLPFFGIVKNLRHQYAKKENSKRNEKQATPMLIDADDNIIKVNEVVNNDNQDNDYHVNDNQDNDNHDNNNYVNDNHDNDDYDNDNQDNDNLKAVKIEQNNNRRNRRKKRRTKKTKSSRSHSSSSSSSSNSTTESNTSLKDMQKSINFKLKQQSLKRLQQHASINLRKRKRVESSNNLHVIKRIKIAINGDIATQRQLSYADGRINNNSSCSSSALETETDDDEEEEHNDVGGTKDLKKQNPLQHFDNDNSMADDDDDNDDYHEVITRNVSDNPNTGNRHIVLTIKKATRIKSNSASPSALLSKKQIVNDDNDVENVVKMDLEPSLQTTITKKTDTINDDDYDVALKSKCIKSNSLLEKCNYVRKRIKKRLLARKKANNNNNNDDTKKQHKRLFHRYELYPRLSFILKSTNWNLHKNNNNYDKLLNISSCSSSSSCIDSSNDDSDFFAGTDFNSTKISIALNKLTTIDNIKTTTTAVTAKPPYTIYENDDNDDDSDNNDVDDDDNDDSNDVENNKQMIPDDDINNYLLKSFNQIYHDNNEVKQQNNNDINVDNDISTNKNNYSRSIINSNKAMLKPNQLNLVNNESILTTTTTAATTNSNTLTTATEDNKQFDSANKQRFKEWHQVLQLRSYNDELLTVLPYVVLD